MSRDPTVPVNLTTTTPVGPVERTLAAAQATDRVERLRYWRRGGSTGIDTTPTGTLLVDFTQQPITATGVTYGASGQQVTNDGAFGNYTVTRNVIAHDSALFGGTAGVTTITLTSDGWEMASTAATSPTVAKDLRPCVYLTPIGGTPGTHGIDFTNVESLTYEWGFPVNTDTCQGLSVGIRPRIMTGAAYRRPANTVLTNQTITKSEKMMTRINCGGAGSTGWTDTSGSPDWANVTELQARMDVMFTNGGTKLVLRRIWANRKQAKAKIAFTFDDLVKNQLDVGFPLLSGVRCGIAATSANLDTSDPDYSPSATRMTMDDVRTLYNAGWAVYPHMRSHSYPIAAAIKYVSYTPGTTNITRFSANTYVIAALNAQFNGVDKTIGVDTVTIRGGWGPEYTGAHVVSAIDVGSLWFEVEMGATAPAQQAAASLKGFRMDFPPETPADWIDAQVVPCHTYLESELGTGFRGRRIFVSPMGDYDPSYNSLLAAVGYSGHRGTENYVTAVPTQTAVAPLKTSTSTVSGTPCAVGWFDKWNIGVISLDGVADNPTNVTKYKDVIDDAVTYGHFLHFMGHGIVASATPAANEISSTLLTELVNYCKTKEAAGTAQFVTLEEVVDAFA